MEMNLEERFKDGFRYTESDEEEFRLKKNDLPQKRELSNSVGEYFDSRNFLIQIEKIRSEINSCRHELRVVEKRIKSNETAPGKKFSLRGRKGILLKRIARLREELDALTQGGENFVREDGEQ